MKWSQRIAPAATARKTSDATGRSGPRRAGAARAGRRASSRSTMPASPRPRRALDDDEDERRPEADVHDDRERDDATPSRRSRRSVAPASVWPSATPNAAHAGTMAHSSFSSRHHVEVVARSDEAERPVGVPAASLSGSPSSVSTARSAASCGSPPSTRASTWSSIEARSSAPRSARCFSGTVRMRGVDVAVGEGRGVHVSLSSGQCVDRRGDRAEFVGECGGQARARGAGAVELARPGLVGVPLAREVSLLLEAAQQGVQRVGVGVEAPRAELLEQPVAVAGLLEQPQAREHDGAAPQLLQVRLECFGLAHASHCTVCHTLSSSTHCRGTSYCAAPVRSTVSLGCRRSDDPSVGALRGSPTERARIEGEGMMVG